MDLFWSMLWFFLFFAWIWLLITIFSDIFRSHDLSGWGKAFWTIFVVILPWLGVLIYLIARGGSMQERAMAMAVAAGEGAERVHPAGVRFERGSLLSPMSWRSWPSCRARVSSPPRNSPLRRRRSSPKDHCLDARVLHGPGIVAFREKVV